MPISGERRALAGGPADVCFDDTGKSILTCGQECDARVFQDIDDIQPVSNPLERGNQGFAIASKGTRYFVGSDASTVDVYKLDDGQHEAQLVQFSAEVTCLAVTTTSQSTLVAAGSGDFNIRIIYYDSESGIVEKTSQYLGHRGPVLSVALDPAGKYIASSSGDGSVKVWDVATFACLKTWDGFIPKVNDYSAAKQLGRMSFEPKTGSILAIPSLKEVRLVNREKWEIIGTLSDSSCQSVPSVAAFSPCGTHVAVGYNDGSLFIYNIASRRSSNTFRSPKIQRVCKIVWNPVHTAAFVYADDQGYIAMVEKAFATTEKATVPAARINAPLAEEKAVVGDSKPGETIFADDFDENSHDAVNSERMAHLDKLEIDDDTADGYFDDDMISNSGRRPVGMRQPTRFREEPTRTKMQKRFQPSATAGERHRFMVWNDVGYMKTYVSDDDMALPGIDVVFHNAAFHRLIHVSNVENFTLGTMNNKGYLLATDEQSKYDESKPKGSVVKFSLFGAETKEWTLALDGEWVEGIALGETCCFVATSRRMLRIITHAGYQQYTLSYPGPLVAVAARNDLFMVTYHQAEPYNGDQVLAVTMYLVGLRRLDVVVSDQRVPISPKSELVWLGFGLRGSPCTVDSAGVVRVYHYKGPLAKNWAPCLDLRARLKNPTDHYFVVALDENTRNVRAIFCRGTKGPHTLPLPTQSLLPLETLQVDMTEDNSKKEAECTLLRFFPPSTEQGLTALSMDALRLFAKYYSNSQDERAMDIMTALVPRAKDLHVFWKFASANCRPATMNKLQQLIAAITQDELEDDVVRAPSPDMFASADLDYKKPITATPSTLNSTKTVTLSRSAVKPSKPTGVRKSIKTEIPDDSDSDEDLKASKLGLNPHALGVPRSRMSRGSSLASDRDEETRMSANNDEDLLDGDDNYKAVASPPEEEEDVDSLMVDTERGRRVISSDSRSNDASLASSTLLFDEDLTNDSDRSNRANMGSNQRKKPSSKLATSTSAVTPTSAGNPFKRAPEKAPPVMRGISTMEEVTKSRSGNKVMESMTDSSSGTNGKRGRKSNGTSVEPAPKKRATKSAASENKFSTAEIPKIGAVGHNVKKTSGLGLERFGFTRTPGLVNSTGKEGGKLIEKNDDIRGDVDDI